MGDLKDCQTARVVVVEMLEDARLTSMKAMAQALASREAHLVMLERMFKLELAWCRTCDHQLLGAAQEMILGCLPSMTAPRTPADALTKLTQLSAHDCFQKGGSSLSAVLQSVSVTVANIERGIAPQTGWSADTIFWTKVLAQRSLFISFDLKEGKKAITLRGAVAAKAMLKSFCATSEAGESGPRINDLEKLRAFLWLLTEPEITKA